MAVDLSSEANQLLRYAFERGGESALVHDITAANEATRAGLIQLVTLGVDEPLVVLTPAGLDHCRAKLSGVDAHSPKLVRAPAIN